MPFKLPETREGLKRAGYVFRYGRRCKDPKCGKEIEFWQTPRGGWMPLDMDPIAPHHSTCVAVERFRKGGGKK